MPTVKVLCCVGCGETRVTLIKLDGPIRICPICLHKLKYFGFIDTHNGTHTLTVKENAITMTKKEVLEEKQND